MKFEFELYRSEEKEHQVHGLKCSSFEVRGETDATSIYRVKDFVFRLMAIPGVYMLARFRTDRHEEPRTGSKAATESEGEAMKPSQEQMDVLKNQLAAMSAVQWLAMMRWMIQQVASDQQYFVELLCDEVDRRLARIIADKKPPFSEILNGVLRDLSVNVTPERR
jgi:hypothetical protein